MSSKKDLYFYQYMQSTVPCTVLYTIVYCTLYTVLYCILYIELYSILYTVLYCTLYTVQYCTVSCIQYSTVLCIRYSTVLCIQYCTVPCTVLYCALYIVGSPCRLYLEPITPFQKLERCKKIRLKQQQKTVYFPQPYFSEMIQNFASIALTVPCSKSLFKQNV